MTNQIVSLFQQFFSSIYTNTLRGSNNTNSFLTLSLTVKTKEEHLKLQQAYTSSTGGEQFWPLDLLSWFVCTHKMQCNSHYESDQMYLMPTYKRPSEVESCSLRWNSEVRQWRSDTFRVIMCLKKRKNQRNIHYWNLSDDSVQEKHCTNYKKQRRINL